MAANEYMITTVHHRTLAQVAHEVYGHGDFLHRLREANRHVHDPNNLLPGTKLVIPRAPAFPRHPQGR